LRVVGIFQSKDIGGGKWFGLDAATDTEQGYCQKM
jgi:hypothetical protein